MFDCVDVCSERVYDSRMTDQTPTSALTKRRITPRTLLVGAGIVAVVAAGGAGVYALAQPPADERTVAAQSEPTETATPTPEPEPNVPPTAYYVVSSTNGLTV